MKNSLRIFLIPVVSVSLLIGGSQISFASSDSSNNGQNLASLESNLVSAQGSASYQINSKSTSIYLSGQATVQVNTPSGINGGYFINVYNNNGAIVQTKDFASTGGSKSFNFTGLNGYHKFEVISDEGGSGSFVVKW